MKLVKRTTLHYQEGTSNRIYEVDLCQIANQRYVVNFRYGKHNRNLKEGTKTIQPVPVKEAQKVFDKLIEQKKKKGYIETSIAQIINKFYLNKPITVDDPHKQAVINRLADDQQSLWKLERAIWRAGELKIREAAPILINLLGTGAPLRDYCIAWTLGWCGASEAIPVVTQLHQNPATPDFVRRIAFEATRIQRKYSQQEVTGVVVNEKPSVSRKTLNKFRATLYQIEKSGIEGKHWDNTSNTIAAITGFADFVAMVNPEKGAEFQEQVKRIKEKLK